MTEIASPRVLFAQGMEAHQQRLHIDPRPMGSLMVNAGVELDQAYAFDVVFLPGKSRIALGMYTKDTQGEQIINTDGDQVELQKRAISYYISPQAKPGRVGLKFALLHETSHMRDDLTGIAPEKIAYHDKEVQKRVKRVGRYGWGLAIVGMSTYAATYNIQGEPERTLLDVSTVGVTCVGMVASVGASMPLGARWMVDKNEWRAHAYAMRNWGADILPQGVTS